MLAVLTVAAVASVACAFPGSSSNSTPGNSSPSPAITGPADSKAADLRARLNLLFGEHVMVIVKMAVAAAGNRTDEYAGYASLLTTNDDDLVAVMSSAFGASAATRFDELWRIQNGYLVDYTIGQVTHNAAKSNGAASGLRTGFVPDFAKFVNSMTQLPLDPVVQLWTEQVLETEAVIGDLVAKNYTKMYADLRTAYAQSWRLGDALASSIARKFADKFPGNPTNKAADFRVRLTDLLQEHAYLATMATGALAGARNAEQAAALVALAANASALSTAFSGVYGAAPGTAFDQVWGAKDAELVIYSGTSDAERRQTALTDLTGPTLAQFTGFVRDTTGISEPLISAPAQRQIQATIRVIDDQRSNAQAQVAADDRTAAAAMEPIANLIATATVAKVPAKF